MKNVYSGLCLGVQNCATGREEGHRGAASPGILLRRIFNFYLNTGCIIGNFLIVLAL